MTKNNYEHQSKRSKHKEIIILLIILPTLLLSCNFPSTNNTVYPDGSQSLTKYSTPFVNVQFNLLLPEPISSDEAINIVVLDEVTGLPYHRQQYEMEPKEENIYTTTLSIPLFSIIKYRYEKMGEEIVPEKTSNGQNVRYRLYHAVDQGAVDDFLYSWTGFGNTTAAGQFEAVVIDQDTGKPIPDILVSIGGQLNFTDSNGLINFTNLHPGTHNVLFYAISGEYQTFHQGAVIKEGKKTLAEVQLSANKPVEVTFIVTPPNDAAGAPVYLAGNFSQFGNTFSDLQGSMNIDSNRMSLLEPQNDGKLAIKSNLYSGTDFRFKFTLGDGYWNSELNADSELITRQLIVPDHDITLELDITAWHAPIFEPITFKTFIHPDIGYPGERYIQFKKDQWTEPIPLWPLGNGNYLYILYSPFEITTPISYRICLTKSCNTQNGGTFISSEAQVEPADQPITLTLNHDQWSSSNPKNSSDNINEAVFPYKSNDFHTSIELSPEMNPKWFSRLPSVLREIKNIDPEVVLISPSWVQNKFDGLLEPEIGFTPFSSDLLNLISEAHSNDLEIGLFPQIDPLPVSENAFHWDEQNASWQEAWFKSYRQFILNYAKLANLSDAKYLILGGKPLLPTLPGENPIYLQEKMDEEWRSLISDVRKEFTGSLVWAANAGLQVDPLPGFVFLFDEIYITVDSPLVSYPNPSFEEIAYGFTETVDNLIYEVYRSTFKPIMIGFAYPSSEGSALGCQLIDDNCDNDGIFSTQELSAFPIDVDQQTEVYNAIFPVAASREWITGISIRGFIPLSDPHDPSSSIAGKPAKDVVEYWYKGLTNNQ